MKAVIFDFDGVLADSLPQHIKFCQNKGLKYNLKLKIPLREEIPYEQMKTFVGVPMSKFLENVGFPENYINPVLGEYKKSFSSEYPVNLFDGVDGMLRNFKKLNYVLSLITANYISNVRSVMGKKNMRLLDFVFTKEKSRGKVNDIALVLKKIKLNPQRVVYVDDRLDGFEIAKQAGVCFVGVSYGWEISNEKHKDMSFKIANSIGKLEELLISIV